MKNRLLILTLGLIGVISSVYGQNFSEFKSIVDNCGMNFNKPNGFIESQIIDNDDMRYEYALKYSDKNFEVRYSIRPIRYKNYSNDTVKNEMESQRSFRNSQYETILKAVILNITGGVDYKVQAFDKDAVKKEFNADWGATTFVELNSDFGKDFKYCMIVAIHKDDIADAYYFYLLNSKDKFMDYVNPLFHSLRFD
jgi:hypothetical protein